MARREPKGRDPFKDVLTTPEIAREKKVAPSAVVRAVNEGRLAAWTKGRMLFIPREEVARWEPVRGRGKRAAGSDSKSGIAQEQETQAAPPNSPP